MTTKHEIEIPGLPEGWRAVEARIDPDQYNKYVGDDGCLYWNAKIKLEKIKPRRIVLEETDEVREVEFGEYFSSTANLISSWPWRSQSIEKYKIWRLRGDKESGNE